MSARHEVLFHIGSGRVVCTCGADFSILRGLHFESQDAVGLWAAHVRETADLNLQTAYDDGWRDGCADHMSQREDPSWPIGARRRGNYPRPAEEGQP